MSSGTQSHSKKAARNNTGYSRYACRLRIDTFSVLGRIGAGADQGLLSDDQIRLDVTGLDILAYQPRVVQSLAHF